MSAYKAAAFAAAAAMLAAVLKKEKAEFALLVQLAAAAALVGAVLSGAVSVFRLLTDCTARSGLDTGFMKLLLRTLCMSAAGEWAAAFCRDAGLSALALAVDTAVKVLMLSACLPLLREALRFAAGFFV
ncbi:MAG: hypothetical protein IJT41_09745 [Clostridia bacterium]|nr:hypothetical protein [Clostridia bacterium]